MDRTNLNTDVFARAAEAFMDLRGLAFTVEWRRFPWTPGTEVDRALVGPAYLGNVSIGLKNGFSWGYQDRDGTWRYVHRDRLHLLVDSVVEHRAGHAPPLPRRSDRRVGGEHRG
ncbi:hypothetical protein ABZ234_14915 [Nocardiopsis sp. NPDC006198]|jgi:hypothetical protein|uniref:hypothetical protein n=1 Tax=Nocardiopsis sp. NPDC006198 TaxID=3154472 RepID=UPI0033B5DCF7